MSPTKSPHLVELTQDRERVAIRRALEAGIPLEPLVRDLGFEGSMFFSVLDLPKSLVLPISGVRPRFAGDIDILFGRMHFSVTGEQILNRANVLALKNPRWSSGFTTQAAAIEAVCEGKLSWPPKTDFLAGLEVKCSLLAGTGMLPEIRSLKQGPGKVEKIRNELQSLGSLGLDRFALLDVIATPPQSSSLAGQSWIKAASLAVDAEDLAIPKLKRRRPLPDARLDHWILSMGAVAGGTEDLRGAGYARCIRRGIRPQLGTAQQPIRKELERGLRDILAKVPRPTRLPVILEFCSNCRAIHFLGRSCK